MPDIALRTTFIVGHPGETEADFEALLDFVRENRFDMVGCFKYSPEKGTPSGTMHDDAALRVPRHFCECCVAVWILRALSVDLVLTVLRAVPSILLERELLWGLLQESETIRSYVALLDGELRREVVHHVAC